MRHATNTPKQGHYLSLPPIRIWHKVKWPERRIRVGVRRKESRIRAEAWALLVYAGHRLTWCYVSRWALLDMDPNMSPDTDARFKLKLDHRVQCHTKVSKMKLTHPKLAQSNPGAFRPRVCLRWTMPRPTRMPDGPAKKPGLGSKANSKLLQLVLSPKQGHNGAM